MSGGRNAESADMPPTEVIDVDSLPDQPVAAAGKRMRHQTQPTDVGRLVAQIDLVYAENAKATAQGARVARLAEPVYVESAGAQVQAGGGAGAACADRFEAAWLRVMHGSNLEEPKPVFTGRCGARTERDVRRMEPLAELPECQPQAAYAPPGDHDSDPFVGPHVNLHRPYKDAPVQTTWEVVGRDA